MPVATAELTKPVNEQPVRIDDSLNQIRQSVGVNADKAIGNKGIHNPIPFAEREIPIHVPKDGSTFTQEVRKGALDVPETFKTNSDNSRHLLDFTGDGAPPRTGDAAEIKNKMQQRNDAVLQARDNPNSEGMIRKIKDWFYDEDKKAA